MVVRLRMASRRPPMLLANWIAGWRAMSSQVEGASTEAGAEAEVEAEAEVQTRADAGEAWKSSDQLS